MLVIKAAGNTPKALHKLDYGWCVCKCVMEGYGLLYICKATGYLQPQICRFC